MSTDQTPTARLMIHALRNFEHALQARLHRDGFADVSVAHTNLLRHLNPEGMRLTALAADAGMTKQGASQGVRALQARELVAIEPDPNDRRAKRVVYTPRGLALIASAIEHIVALEGEWSDHLGTDRYASLREGLIALAAHPADSAG